MIAVLIIIVRLDNYFFWAFESLLWPGKVCQRWFLKLRIVSGACCWESLFAVTLQAVFTQYQFSERSALPADSLRRALAHTFADQQRFQMGLMDDASECFVSLCLLFLSNVSSSILSTRTGFVCSLASASFKKLFTLRRNAETAWPVYNLCFIIFYCRPIIFIHLYSASNSMSLSEALQTTANDTVSEFTCRSCTAYSCKWRTYPRSLRGG